MGLPLKKNQAIPYTRQQQIKPLKEFNPGFRMVERQKWVKSSVSTWGLPTLV